MIFLCRKNKNLIPACQSRYTFLFVSLILTFVLKERKREREREREKEREGGDGKGDGEGEFFLYQKLWDLLDYEEKVDKSDTNFFTS